MSDQWYVCADCKKRVGESDIIFLEVPSDVGWKDDEGNVIYPMIGKKFCPKCADRHIAAELVLAEEGER